MSIESVTPSNHLILCHLLLLLLPSIFPSIRVFSNERALHIRPKYWSFSFSISPSDEYSGLISFRTDRVDFLAVQQTQESSPIPQFNSINSSVLTFIVQLSHPCMTPGKTIALTRQTFVSKVTMSLLFSTQSRFVITFLPVGKHLLISRLQPQSTVILEPKKVASVTASTYARTHVCISLSAGACGAFCSSVLTVS